MLNTTWNKKTVFKYIEKHQSLFRWLLFFVNIIFLLFIVKSYINYWNIEQAIIQEKLETHKVQEHIFHLNNFKKQYLQSEYSPYLLWHENKRLFDNEIVIYFVYEDKKEIKNSEKSHESIITKKPIDQRKKLIQQKIWYVLQ